MRLGGHGAGQNYYTRVFSSSIESCVKTAAGKAAGCTQEFCNCQRAMGEADLQRAKETLVNFEV